MEEKLLIHNKALGKPRKSPEEYSFKEIACLGKVFFNAAEKCNQPQIENIGLCHPFVVPIIVNMSFSCELLLKAILRYEKKEIKTHSLIKLFDELQDDIRRDIVASCNEKDFRYKLITISNYFEEWRYLYEQYMRSVDYGFLKNFSEKLLHVVENLEK